MKVGIIRCMQTEDYCPGSGCFQAVRDKSGAFAGEEEVEVVGYTIAFASCIQKGTPIGYPCPFAKKMKELVQKEGGDAISILDGTH